MEKSSKHAHDITEQFDRSNMEYFCNKIKHHGVTTVVINMYMLTGELLMRLINGYINEEKFNELMKSQPKSELAFLKQFFNVLTSKGLNIAGIVCFNRIAKTIFGSFPKYDDIHPKKHQDMKAHTDKHISLLQNNKYIKDIIGSAVVKIIPWLYFPNDASYTDIAIRLYGKNKGCDFQSNFPNLDIHITNLIEINLLIPVHECIMYERQYNMFNNFYLDPESGKITINIKQLRIHNFTNDPRNSILNKYQKSSDYINSMRDVNPERNTLLYCTIIEKEQLPFARCLDTNSIIVLTDGDGMCVEGVLYMNKTKFAKTRANIAD